MMKRNPWAYLLASGWLLGALHCSPRSSPGRVSPPIPAAEEPSENVQNTVVGPDAGAARH
jgi:hypothetical protein